MSSTMAENKFMKVMPKQLANQLNLIKKDKEYDEQRKMQSDDCTLQSDRIVQSQFKRRNSSPKRGQKDDDSDGNDKWKKVAPKQKQIKKISLSSLKETTQKWQKNPELAPAPVKPKKKITIQRDETGKAYFEEEIVQPNTGSNNGSRVVHHQHHDQRMDQESDSLDDSYDNIQKDNDEYNHKQSNQSSNLNSRRLSIKKNNPKLGFIQAENLPHQIDNQFLRDLLKKEKDHILDSYKQDNIGRVKFSSKEAAERAVRIIFFNCILNKRKLYGSEIMTFEINEEDFERQTQSNNNSDQRSNLSSRIQSKNRR